MNAFPLSFSSSGRNGQLQASKNVNFSLNSNDLGRDQAAGSGAKKWSLLTCCLTKAGLIECNVHIQEDPDALLTEDEYRRRRPLPMFRHHHKLENLVLNLRKIVSTEVSAERHQNWIRIYFFFILSKWQKKCKIISYVVASGLQYGKEENLFHYFFKVDIISFLKEALAS